MHLQKAYYFSWTLIFKNKYERLGTYYSMYYTFFHIFFSRIKVLILLLHGSSILFFFSLKPFYIRPKPFTTANLKHFHELLKPLNYIYTGMGISAVKHRLRSHFVSVQYPVAVILLNIVLENRSQMTGYWLVISYLIYQNSFRLWVNTRARLRCIMSLASIYHLGTLFQYNFQ